MTANACKDGKECSALVQLNFRANKQDKRKETSVDRQTLCAPLLDLIIGKSGKLIFKTSKENATREIKNILR